MVGGPPSGVADPIRRLILELGRLPGVGERSAARLAYYIVRASCPAGERGGPTLAQDLAAALAAVAREVGLCPQCCALTAARPCAVCADPRRDGAVLCVVEGMSELRAVEQSGAHRGRYHVLHGALAPLDGIGPEQLGIDALLQRLGPEGVAEVLLATGTDVEGDTTALYIAERLRPLKLRVTRLASGVPLGGELEYLDPQTLSAAIAQRQPI